MDTTLYKVKSGSHLYGTNTPESDEDYISVIMPTTKDLLGIDRVDFVDKSTKQSDEKRRNNSSDIDDHRYMLHYFLKLVMSGNPNLTEILFAPKEVIEQKTPLFDQVIQLAPNMISKKHISSFLGFSTAQMSKLEVKGKRYNSLRMAKEYLEVEYDLEELNGQIKFNMTELVAAVLNSTVEYYKGDKNNTEPFHKGLSPQITYKKIKSEYENYGWRVNTESFSKLGYDTKFASHAVRLLLEAQHLAKYGRLLFPLAEKNLILDIKNGSYKMEELRKYYDVLLAETKEIIKINEEKMPEEANFYFVNDWLTRAYSVFIKECC